MTRFARSLLAMAAMCRPGHWIKNIVLFLPPFFLGVAFREDILRAAFPAFASFSLAASAVYALNDLADRRFDANHPAKKLRPVASGAVSPAAAAAAAALLAAAALAISLRGHAPAFSFAVLATYLCVNASYSFGLKNVALVDIFLLASGFVFRIFYGGFFFGVEISSWMFLCIFSGALYFACGKRKNELARTGSGAATRSVLGKYTAKFLDAHYYMFCGLAILFYCLWTVTRTDQHAVGKLALTIPVMVFILARYNWLVETGKSDGDPVPSLFHDVWLVAASILFAVLNFTILYFGASLPRVVY